MSPNLNTRLGALMLAAVVKGIYLAMACSDV
jgi:hypothetical protein